MSKKTLLAKRVLTALALGSVLYAPVAMAATYTVETDITVTSHDTYKAQDTVYIKNATLTLDAGALANNFDVGFNIEKANGASTSTLVVKNGHFWVGDEDSPSKLNVDKVIVGDNGHITLDGYGLNIGKNLRTVEINSVAPQGGTAFYYGALYDGPLTAAGDTELDHFGANVTGAGTFFIDADLIFDDSKTGDKYNYTISSGVDILYCKINDPSDGCNDEKFDCSLTISADQLTGNLPIRNAGNLILTGGKLTRNIVAGTCRNYDYTKPEGQKEWFTEQGGEVYVTGDALTVAENVKVQQVMYGGRGSSDNTLNLTLEEGSKVNQVIGGFNDDGGNANNNNLTITGSGKVLGDNDDDVEIADAVVGGWSLEKSANGNHVSINGITAGFGVTGGAVEGYGYRNAQTGTANNNTVEITNAKVEAGWIFGGAAAVNDGMWYEQGTPRATQALTAGAANNNVVTITGSTIGSESKEVAVVGGLSDVDLGEDDSKQGDYAKQHRSSNVGNNTVTITNSTVYGDVYGGYSATGSVTGNEVELNGVAVGLVEIMGGNTTEGNGNATNNAVTIDGGTFGKDDGTSFVRVYGAYGGKGDVLGNSIVVDNGTFKENGYHELVGGSGSGNVTGNTVTFNSGTFNGEDIVGGQHSPLADSNKTVSQNNVVIDSGNISVTFGVYGGYSEKGKVSGNNLTIKDGTFAGTQGLTRYAGGFTEGGDASGNTVVVGADTTTPKFYGSAWVIGGASVDADDKSKGIVSGNNITIYNAAFNLVESGEEVVQRYTHIVAGRGGDGDVTNNNLVIKNITLNSNIGTAEISKNNVWGGFAQNEGNVSGNSIAIEKGILNINLMAGGSSNFGAATNNTVTISGRDTVINGGTIFGGRCYQGEGEVSGNVVDISDATIKANVFGGWSSVQNKAHDNKVYLNAVTVGSSTEETYSINASKDNKESKGGVVQVKDGGLVNNANLTLGGGKVKIDGNITGAGNLTINSNTGEINASVTQTSLTLGKEGITTHTVTASMDNIHVTTLTNNGTFNVSGTLNQAINGNGTNKVLQNTILSLGANASLNNLTLAGTLNLQNDAYATTTIANLTANTGSKVNFDAKFSATGDQISATTASGTLALGSIGLKEDFDGDVGATKVYTLLTDGAAAVKLTGSAEAVMGAYKYVFTPGSVAGTLTVTKDYGYSLYDIINNSDKEHKAGAVSNYSLNADKTETEGLGTLTRVDSTKAREFTINGNSKKLTAPTGITVNAGDTLILKDITYDVTSGNAVSGDGTANIAGTVTISDNVETEMVVADSSTLNIGAGNIGNIVTNGGTINLGGGTLAQKISGGNVVTAGDVTAAADKFDRAVVTNGNILTLEDGTLNSNVSGSGETVIDGSVVLMEGKSIESALAINQGRDLKVNGVLAGATSNKGVLNLGNGATNTGIIRNYGTINIGDGFIIGNQIASGQTGSDTVNITGTVVENGVESGKYAVGASVLNVTGADITSDNRRSLRAYETTITNSIVDTEIRGLWRGDSPTNEVYGNTLTVVNSTLKQSAAAGQNSTYQETMGNVYNNSVSISGSEVVSVDGAYNVIYDSTSLTKAYTAGDVYGNSVTIGNNSTVTIEVYGGESFVKKNGDGSPYFSQHKTGNVYNNSVEITNSTVKGTVYGGYSRDGEIHNNTISLINVKLDANVYGGYSDIANKAYSNTVKLDKVTIASGEHVVYASTKNQQSKGGLVNVLGQGLVNNGTTTLGGGKVQIDGAVTGTGNLTILSNTGEINASVTQTSLTLGKEEITTHTVTASMDNIHVTTLTNNGTFNVSGTLNQAINGNGTNKVLQNTILSLGANASLNNLTLAGTLNLQNDAYATTTIANLTANTGSKVNFDAKFSAEGDQISATTASGTLALGSIGLKEDFEGDVGISKTYTLLKDGAANIALTGSAEAVMGAYKYVFTVGDTAGTLKVTKDYGYSLQAIIQDSEPNHVAGKVSNYSLNADKTLDADLGTLTRVDSTKPREFTINGNGNKLLGNGKNGITVNSGDTLTYKDIAEVSGFNGAAVINNGTFNLQGVTMKNGIAGSGTTVVENGTSAFEAGVANAIRIAETGVLKAKGEYVTNTVDNAGEYHFQGGNVNRAVTGAGTMYVDDNAVFNAKVDNSLSVASGKMVTGNVDLSAARIDLNNAVLNMASGKKLTVTSKLNMIGGETVVALDKDNILDAALKVKTGLGDIINGVDGLLVLQFGGAEYTATSHRDARVALFGDGENAALQFDNAVLKIDTVNETLAVQGEKSGNEVTMNDVQPTVYDKGGEEVEPVGAQENKTVGVIDNTGALVAADKVTFGGASNVVAKDLQIEGVATATKTFELLVNSSSTLSLVGSDGYLVRNKSNVAVTTNITVDSSTLVIGQGDAAAPTAVNGLDTLTITNSAASLYNVIMNAVKLAMGAGGKLWIDPSYVKSDTITIASGASVGAATDGSVLNIAMTENNLQKALEAAGVEFDADSKLVGAENGVFAYNAKTLGTLDLTGNRHLVVADEPGDQYALELGAGSVLVVETTKDKEAAFKVENAEDVSVDGNTAKLVVSADDFEVGVSEYKILTATDGEFDELWLADNIFASDPTYKLTFKGAGSVYTLTTDWNKVEGIFGEGAIAAPEMYNRMLQKGNGTDANGFLKGVINATAGAGSTAASKAAGANALNSASNLNGVANVEHGLYTAFNMGSEALYTHLADKGQERGIWASYINNKETVDGFNLGAGLQADYDAKYNGVIVGADLVKTGKSIMGVSVNYTTGDVTSNGNIRTNNDSKYYGVSLYGRTELGEETEAALLYDVSYMHGKSEITQHNFGKEITADAKSDAFSVGLRAEKGFKMGQGSLTPYIGLRYLHIGTGDYESNLKMKYDASDLNMVLLPVGLTYKANIQSGRTTWSPMVSVGYLWNLSGKDTTQNVSFDGVKSSFDYDVADRGSFFARLGIEAQVKNATYGIGYQFMKGSSTKNSRWNVSVNFSF